MNLPASGTVDPPMSKPSPVADFFSRVLAILVAAAIIASVVWAAWPQTEAERLRELRERTDRILERRDAERARRPVHDGR